MLLYFNLFDQAFLLFRWHSTISVTYSTRVETFTLVTVLVLLLNNFWS
jgi:hypothetical protein